MSDEREVEHLQALLRREWRDKLYLAARLCACPSIETRITTGPRKAWDGAPFLDQEGWVQLDWERFDYHEEITWVRGRATDNYEAEQRAVADELERLRSIVSDLAATHPQNGYHCLYCMESMNNHLLPPDTYRHADGCLWLRATQEAKP